MGGHVAAWRFPADSRGRGLFAVRGLASLLLGLFPLLLTQRVVLLVLGVDLAFGGLIGGARGDRRVLRIGSAAVSAKALAKPAPSVRPRMATATRAELKMRIMEGSPCGSGERPECAKDRAQPLNPG